MSSMCEMNEFILSQGFKTGDYFIEFETIEQAKYEIYKVDAVKDKLDVMIDGMVIKVDDCLVRDDIGYTNKWEWRFKKCNI